MMAFYKTTHRFAAKFILLALTSIMITSCSTTKNTPEHQLYVGETPVHDPFEGANRAVFAFNNTIDNILIHPVVEGYRFIIPKPARTGFSNFLSNLNSPVRFANQLLQGDLEGAGTVLTRAIINTLIGVGGIFDVAAYEGIEMESEDFGQTMAVWGIGNGPYMVVPFLGPSTLRDYAGFFVDAYANPLNLYLFNTDQDAWAYAKTGADYLVLRDSLMDVLKDLERSSVDYYASTRSIYYQRRNALIKDTNRNDIGNSSDDYADFDFDDMDF